MRQITLLLVLAVLAITIHTVQSKRRMTSPGKATPAPRPKKSNRNIRPNHKNNNRQPPTRRTTRRRRVVTPAPRLRPVNRGYGPSNNKRRIRVQPTPVPTTKTTATTRQETKRPTTLPPTTSPTTTSTSTTSSTSTSSTTSSTTLADGSLETDLMPSSTLSSSLSSVSTTSSTSSTSSTSTTPGTTADTNPTVETPKQLKRQEQTTPITSRPMVSTTTARLQSVLSTSTTTRPHTFARFCETQDTVFTPHPGSNCVWFYARRGRGPILKTQLIEANKFQSGRCPQGTIFNVSKCVCDWSWRTTCYSD